MDNIYFYIGIAFFVVVLIYWVWLIIKFWLKKKLTKKDKTKFKKILNEINQNKSLKEKIIDYDKLYHRILMAYWYRWGFGFILKLWPNEIDDLDKIWELHKFRNSLVHEFDRHTEKTLSKVAKDYRKEIEKLLK